MSIRIQGGQSQHLQSGRMIGFILCAVNSCFQAWGYSRYLVDHHCASVMNMKKIFKSRLKPTGNQIGLFETRLEECRKRSNQFLEHRRDSWTHYGVFLGLYDLIKTFPELKRANPSCDLVHSLVLQNVAVRTDLAYQAFFRRIKDGENPSNSKFKI